MSLRDDHREQTRQRISAAVLELLATESPATISVPQVAEKSGISLRTVYRYFPTKADLIASAGREFGRSHDELIAERVGYHWSEPGTDFGRFLEARWAEMHQNLDGIRVQHSTSDGRDGLRARVERWCELSGSWLDATVGELEPDERADVIDLLNALASTSLFLELVDRQGHSPEKAAELAMRARSAVIAELMAEDPNPDRSR